MLDLCVGISLMHIICGAFKLRSEKRAVYVTKAFSLKKSETLVTGSKLITKTLTASDNYC